MTDGTDSPQNCSITNTPKMSKCSREINLAGNYLNFAIRILYTQCPIEQ